MPACLRAAWIAVAALLVTAPGLAQMRPSRGLTPGASRVAPEESKPRDAGSRPDEEPGARPNLPTVRIGALLPLTGIAAWFGKEMRQGMELAVAELNRLSDPAGQRRDAGAGEEAKKPATGDEPRPSSAGDGDAKKPAEPPVHDEGLTPPGVHLALEALDVSARDIKHATESFNKLAAGRLPVLFTASVTPTVTVQPLATARDVLLVHQGIVAGRLSQPSRLLLHTRATPAARVDGAVTYARERGLRRLAVLAAGDDFGQAARAALVSAWRDAGAALVYQESLTIDTPDLMAKLRRLVRAGPEAVLLAFRGSDLGDLAARLREAGYTKALLAIDDDPSALAAGGPALDDAAVVTDAFVPEPSSRGERFARAYAAKYKERPSLYAANAYDAVVMLAEALGPLGSGATGARVREALAKRKSFPSVYGPPLVVRDDGTVQRPLALFTVEWGRLTFVRYLTRPES